MNEIKLDIHKDKIYMFKRDSLFYYDCPKCNDQSIKFKFNFCPNCGSKINWIDEKINEGEFYE